MQLEELVESVIGKWSSRGYIEEEMAGSIAADLHAELLEHLDGGAFVLTLEELVLFEQAVVRGGFSNFPKNRALQKRIDEALEV